MLDFKLDEAHHYITLNLPVPAHSSKTPRSIKWLQGAKLKVLYLQDTFSHLGEWKVQVSLGPVISAPTCVNNKTVSSWKPIHRCSLDLDLPFRQRRLTSVCLKNVLTPSISLFQSSWNNKIYSLTNVINKTLEQVPD